MNMLRTIEPPHSSEDAIQAIFESMAADSRAALVRSLFNDLPDAEALRVLYALADRWSGESYASDDVIEAVKTLADDMSGACGFEDGEHLLEARR